jgi:hypothetical protein
MSSLEATPETEPRARKKVFQLTWLYYQFMKTMILGVVHMLRDTSPPDLRRPWIMRRVIDPIVFVATWIVMVPLGLLIYGTNMAPLYGAISAHVFPAKLVRPLVSPLMKEPALWPLGYTLIAATIVEATAIFCFFRFPEHRTLILTVHLFACCSQMLFWFIMDHKAVHKLGLFKSPVLNFYHHFVLGPFYGFPGQTFAYHVFNHHVENNGPDDITYIMNYRRDRLDDFFRFLWTFVGVTTIAPLLYYRKKGRKEPLRRATISLALNVIIFSAGFYFLGPWVAFIVFVVPLMAGSFVTGIHTWAEHGFVTPGKADDLAAATSTWRLSNPPDLLDHVPKRVLPYFMVHIDEKAHYAHHARPTKIPLPLEPLSAPEHNFTDNPQWLGGDRNWTAFHMLRGDFATIARYLSFDPSKSEAERVAEVATMVRAGPDPVVVQRDIQSPLLPARA